MQTVETHLVFVDGPDIDALAPALDPRFGVKKFILLTSALADALITHMAEVVADSGIATSVVALEDGWHPESIQTALDQALAAAEGGVALNLSAANPAQVVHAFAWARAEQVPVFVVQPERDNLIWLAAPPHFSGFNVADRLTLEGYFNTFGIEVEAIGATLSQRLPSIDGFLRKWVRLVVSEPEKAARLRSAMYGKSEGDFLPRELDHDIQLVLRSLSCSGLVSAMADGRIRLNRSDSVGFLGGGWLEHYVLMVLLDISAGLPIQDAALGLRLKADNGVSCEFDVAILYNNTLFVIECKSGKSTSSSPIHSLFKLDSLTSQAGLDAEALLASLSGVTNNEQARAAWHGIGLAAAADLLSLKATLIDWFQRHAGVVD